MDEDGVHPAVRRALRDGENGELLDSMINRISGADLTSLLMEVVRRRAAGLTAADVMRQYQRDRFVQPATVDPRRLMELELMALSAVDPPFVPIATSPLAPLGTHSVIAGVGQNRLVATVRGTEVAADPTNSLALEAAVRRRALLAEHPRAPQTVHLAAVDRVVRAQHFDGPRSFPHFSLLGLVSAGRDSGNRRFEHAAVELHLRALAAIVRAAGVDQVTIQLTDFDGGCADVVDRLIDALRDGRTNVVRWNQRSHGRGYYTSLCCKVVALTNGEEVEVGDGGLVDWTQSLLGSAKERLMISGLSLERLALIS